MKVEDLLPEGWVEASKYRYRKYQTDSLKILRSKKALFDYCEGCPGFRVMFLDVYGSERILTSCVFFDKCIKQYPHKVDIREFT